MSTDARTDTQPRLGSRARAALLFLPALALLIVFFVVPLGRLLWVSLSEPSLGIGNYTAIVNDPVAIRVMMRTLVMAGIVTITCVLLAFPYAYLMTVASRRWRGVLIAVVLVPFWTSLMSRTFAWVVIMQQNGLMNKALESVGLGPVTLIGTTTGVTIAMAQVMLPFIVLPLYASMRTVDGSLISAALSLGARPFVAFWKVYLPLTRPGLSAGAILVAVLSLGFYVTPALIGSPQQSMLAQYISVQVNQLLNFGRAGALAFALLVVTLVLIWVVQRLARTGGSQGVSVGAAATVGGAARPTRPGKGLRRYLTVHVVLVGAWLILPTLIVVPVSFSGTKSFSFPPKSWSLVNYQTFFSDGPWLQSLLTSVQLAIVVTVLATILGVLAAFAIDRSTSSFRGPIEGFMTAPLIIPGIVLAVAFYAAFLQWGLVGSFFGFVVAHTVLALPFVIMTTRASLASFDRTLEGAAASLGAGWWASFWQVTFPIVRPGILAGALFAFVTSFDEVVVSLFIKSPTMETLPVRMYSSVATEVDPTIAAAATFVLVISTAVVALAQFSRRETKRG